MRAGINTGNFLLVTGRATNDDAVGVSPDVAAEIARRLGIEINMIPYTDPASLADAAERGEWDVGNIRA